MKLMLYRKDIWNYSLLKGQEPPEIFENTGFSPISGDSRNRVLLSLCAGAVHRIFDDECKIGEYFVINVEEE